MKTVKLGSLNKGQGGRIVSVRGVLESGEDFTSRLLEMGLLEGARVDVLHEAPFGGDPLAVRVRGGIIALRRAEANCIEVSHE